MAFPINERMSEGLSIQYGKVFSALGTSADSSGAISLKDFRKIMLVGTVTTIGASATATFKFQGATTSGGSYTDISGASVAITASGKIKSMEISAESILNLGLGYTYVKAVSVNSDNSATSLASILVIGCSGHDEPIAGKDVAAVQARTIL